MAPLYKILLPVFSVMCWQTAKAQNILQLWYPDHINMLPDCNATIFDRDVPFTTNTLNEIRLYGLKINSNECTLLYNGKVVQAQDTISLTATKPAIFKIRFQGIAKNQSGLKLSFETSIDSMEIFRTGVIQLLFNEYVISQYALDKQQDPVVALSKSCLDSIKVYFPFGGTETGVSLFKSQKSVKPIRSIWYQFDNKAINYITFSKQDIGRYFVVMSSCHSGQSFWLTIQ